jgi:hypothetical protein
MACRPLYWIAIAVAAPTMLGAGLWAAMALWVRLIPASLTSDIVACAMILLTLTAMICLGLRRWRVVGLWGVAFAVILGWWAMLTPSNDRAWAPDTARTPYGVVESDRLILHNVRHFVWRSDIDFDEHWETRAYDLGQITGADLFMSYWTGEAIAHTILSFGFTDGQHLAFSIEIRREKAESYSALAGFFRTYELAMIAADERDVVGVRTNVRGEDVRLYRLRMPPDRARALLQEYVGQANALHRAPQFYNSLTTNCTTQIFRMVRALQPGIPLDYRMLLAGLVPDYIYDRGGLDTRLPFETLREKSHIQGRAASSDFDFSSKIREGVPSPRVEPLR